MILKNGTTKIAEFREIPVNSAGLIVRFRPEKYFAPFLWFRQ
jgi:hypothetical protein